METGNESQGGERLDAESTKHANDDGSGAGDASFESTAAINGGLSIISHGDHSFNQSSAYLDLTMAMALQEIFETEPASNDEAERIDNTECPTRTADGGTNTDCPGDTDEHDFATNDDEVPVSGCDQSHSLFHDMTIATVLLMGVLFAIVATVAFKQSQQSKPVSPRAFIEPSTSEPTAWSTGTPPPEDHYTETYPGEALVPPPFSFYVMGDVPYDEAEAWILDQQLEEMANSRHKGSAFGVHVGDFQRWQNTGCKWQTYVDFRTQLLKSPVPMFVLAGDNDSIDCWNSTEAFQYFQDTFSTLEQWWNGRIPEGIDKLEVNRNWGLRPEMFSFVAADGILFLSTNLLNAPSEQVDTDEWQARTNDSARWVISEAGSAFWHHDIRGVVMFSHAEPSHILKDYYLTIWEQVFRQRPNIPVLNIHGDGHIFKIDRHFSEDTGWWGFTDVQVDQGGKADPLLIEVAPIRNGVMEPFREENEMQFVFGEGLFRIDRQKGRYPTDGGNW